MSNYYYVILAFVVSLGFTLLTMPLLLKICYKKRLYDIPNERKVHNILVPRLGGILFLPAMLVSMSAVLMFKIYTEGVMELSSWTFIFISGIFIIYIVGVFDDLLGLGANAKFIVQVVTALAFPLSNVYVNNLYGLFGVYEIPFYVGYIVTVFCTLFIINAMNLIDGIDGLSSGLSVMAMLGFAFLFYINHIYIYTVFALAAVASVVVFMYFNIYGSAEKQTKTFMGDTGSLTLGYLLSFMAVKYSMNNEGIMPYRSDALLISYSLLMIPVFDVVRVILFRMRKHKPLFGADKSHIHHKLLRIGYSQHKTLLTIIGLMVFFILLNISLRNILNFTLIVVIDIILWTIFNLWLDKKWKAVNR
ncbi:MAG: undecaprenyl/decaprenyl-phosphate alpha-N-acetylglucosaminyl 1-phosphate transferase [Bacteroidaceae bacterium]|nr:undecaprenyl/decaprenyl-phosphate alpha-N-acetylglucosaminyl 1-phosphate transferase [Bacteroidaceae bacterium]